VESEKESWMKTTTKRRRTKYFFLLLSRQPKRGPVLPPTTSQVHSPVGLAPLRPSQLDLSLFASSSKNRKKNWSV